MTLNTATPASARDGDGSLASPLGSARSSLGRSLTDQVAAVAHLDARVIQVDAEISATREELELARSTRARAVALWARLGPQDAAEAFDRELAVAAALAVLEERRTTLGERLREADARRLDLIPLAAALDELAAVGASAHAQGADRFRSASRQVFQIIEEERMRIARDMHDGPAQSLANLVLQAEVLERLVGREVTGVHSEIEDFKSCVRGALEETRRLIFDLRPMTLDDLGLVPTLRRYVVETGERAGVRTRFHLVGSERRLSGNLEGVVFRIVQEALTNAIRHAHAADIEVAVTLQPHRVTAVVRDDGEGFDVVATEARQGRTRHLGLISMRERTDLERGRLEVRSQTGRGTEVRVSFEG